MNPPEIMHGETHAWQDVAGWYASEKLDGFRCIWTGNAFVSRYGNAFNVPPWWLRGMPKCSLDGELYAGRGTTHNDVKRLVARGEWERLTFCPWDIPEPGLRIELTQERLSRMTLPAHVHRVIMRPVASTEAARAIMEAVCKQGGEGIMLRRPKSIYCALRTDSLLKMKGAAII